MDARQAREYLEVGVTTLARQEPAWQRREDYLHGKQDLPFAPEGVNEEYRDLQEMAIANWLEVAKKAPVQRLRADGIRLGGTPDQDADAWANVWQANKMDLRQRIIYDQMWTHGRGIASVWPNPVNRAQPTVRPESSRRVHIEMHAHDPYTSEWAVKTFSETPRTPGLFGTPAGKKVAYVYDSTDWMRFEKGGVTLSAWFGKDWKLVDQGANPLGEPPFAVYDLNLDADGKPHNAIEPLMPAQDAINTIRFYTLLAMQFSAHRQRVFTGYDPVLRDEKGAILWHRNADGSFRLDGQGQPMPMLSSPGRIGVDRALVFPGADTKVFDLPESNLKNYVEVLGEFLTQFFATGQVPPQYLISRMVNLSGDALAGAESTLASLVRDMQTSTGEGHEHTFRLGNKARGAGLGSVASEIVWGDGEARSFAATVDGIVKLVSINFPREAAFEMIPGATQTKVARWMGMLKNEATDPELERALRALEASAPPAAQ